MNNKNFSKQIVTVRITLFRVVSWYRTAMIIARHKYLILKIEQKLLLKLLIWAAETDSNPKFLTSCKRLFLDDYNKPKKDLEAERRLSKNVIIL